MPDVIGEILIEMEGWSFVREADHYHSDDYIHLAHMKCPKGVQLEVIGPGEPSVMHYQAHTCQRCGQSPPDGLFGLYAMYAVGTGAQV